MFSMIIFLCGALLGVALLFSGLAAVARIFGSGGVSWLLLLAALFGVFAFVVFAAPGA